MIPKTFPGDKFYKSCYNINYFETWQVSVGTWHLDFSTWHLDSGTWHLDLRFADLHQATKLACTRSSAISEEELKGCADTIHGTARTNLQSTRHKEKNTQVHTANTQVHTDANKSTNAHIASPQELVGNPRCNVAPLIIAKHNQLSTLGIFTNV